MEFNTDTLLAAFDSPVIVIGGVKYPTKQLSFKEYLLNQKKLASLTTMEPEDVIALIEHICGLVDLPADKVMSLPMNLAIQVVVQLFTDTNNTPKTQ